MFNLTKSELLDIVANDEDPDQRVDAQKELDRRAAKKAAERVTNFERSFEESQEVAMGKAALDALPGIGDVQELIINLRDASSDPDLRATLQTVGDAIDEALAGLPMFVAGHKIR